ncbi:Uncharacterized protein BP5553_02533 [Venustampulla echinocandica]|uniref:Arrestin-like N-terminal domain-containing protein n=1 Tax=Venustampulla echinocandica TaxID=2656787 RepID=A0A370U452_9HELO|nr:Uncharacterized protein BP5553_02533 [Venustampulla echinocandica]RDL42554.1 Uncharacterized protein BP5553_02533 [Venustampulla echinocandica]
MGSDSNSIQSQTGTIGTYAKRLAQQSQTYPDMSIFINDHVEGKAYTTYDALSGKVDITAPNSSRFDEIQISLEGVVKTYAISLAPTTAAAAKSNAVHRFLRMAMPIAESDYPQPRIAEAGRTYTFPFNFVVPDQLLPRSCSHDCPADHVREAHLQLPPSMGDREVSQRDDLAPEMTKVQYAIRVKVVRTSATDGKQVVLTEGLKMLNIIPAVAAAPPLNVTKDDEYVLSKTKTLKKGLFSGKLGKITASAAQPNAIILPAPNSSTTTAATTMAKIQLRFDPHDESSQPPRLGGLSTKIKASSFFSVRPVPSIPTHNNPTSQIEPHKGVYHTSVPLSSRCVESVSWTQHLPGLACTRRDSASSSGSSSSDDSNRRASDLKPDVLHYTATIVVPITLPSTKAWIPTFHNCLASRIYILDLSLSIHTPGAGVPAYNIGLHLPVQIAAASNFMAPPALTAAEEAAELAASADEHLRPRVMEVPSENLIENSVLPGHQHTVLPPSYEVFAARPARQIVAPGRC